MDAIDTFVTPIVNETTLSGGITYGSLVIGPISQHPLTHAEFLRWESNYAKFPMPDDISLPNPSR